MKKNIKAMTLLEILIIVSIIMIVIIGILALLRPQEQFNKANDAKRKNDLNELRKILEDWYSDKGCYPKISELCFNNLGSTCEICTSNPSSPSLTSYSTSIICDPQTAVQNYLYYPTGDANCPGAFMIYTKLASTYSKVNDIYGCSPAHGCGPPPTLSGYDYLVTSPNAYVQVASDYYCLTSMNRCSSCGTYEACDLEVQRRTCQSIYSSHCGCCSANPGAAYCPC